MKNENGENRGEVGPDTTATILQAAFQHYFGMAFDHHTKASTTSNFLIVIVGALVGLVTLDQRVGGAVDLIVGLVVFVVGLFGAAWTWKQHERYFFWQHVARKYEEELAKWIPRLHPGETYFREAEGEASKEYTLLFAKVIHERWLWVSLHGIVALIGILLAALSLFSLTWGILRA